MAASAIETQHIGDVAGVQEVAVGDGVVYQAVHCRGIGHDTRSQKRRDDRQLRILDTRRHGVQTGGADKVFPMAARSLARHPATAHRKVLPLAQRSQISDRSHPRVGRQTARTHDEESDGFHGSGSLGELDQGQRQHLRAASRWGLCMPGCELLAPAETRLSSSRDSHITA